MKKFTLPLSIVVAFIVISVIAISGYQQILQKKFTKESEISSSSIEPSIEPTNIIVENKNSVNKNENTDSSRYIPYSKSALDKASNSRRVLFFYASWCPTCKPADANFTQNAGKIPEDVTLIRVNYNDPETDQEEKDLAKKYGITYQHTYVQIDSAGKEVTKWNGGQIDELLSHIKP